MFIFKTAVVGDGETAAAIAAVIDAAGIPVTHIAAMTGFESLGDVDLVIEAASDQLEYKQSVLSELDDVLPGRTILATSAEDYPVTELAEATARPDLVVGLHFLEPVAKGRVVEVVQGEFTSPETMQTASGFVQSLRRTPVRCADAPGLVVERILAAAAESATEQEPERAALRTLVEAALVLEEGVAALRDIDVALLAGAGIKPPPFAAADQQGLDELLLRLERAAVEWDADFDPPAILRRLVAQGRLGRASGQGFFPYPRPDAGWEERPVKLETRDEIAIAWLDRPPANSISPEVAGALRELWETVSTNGTRALVIASANPMLFCAGADIKAFAQMQAAQAGELAGEMHALLRAMETSSVVTIAAVNGLALGGGCELAMACDLRIASESASFGQPEINLGIIPGFGGTQRLPRLVGTSKSLEMSLTGDPIDAGEAYELGLVSELVDDLDLLDTALAWARKLAGQAPLAVERIKRVSAHGDLDAGLTAEQQAFADVFASADAAEGFAAFAEKRDPKFTGK